MSDLNSDLPPNSGWVITQANALNEAGQITGVGSHSGATHAFLLTLVQGYPLQVPVIATAAPPMPSC